MHHDYKGFTDCDGGGCARRGEPGVCGAEQGRRRSEDAPNEGDRRSRDSRNCGERASGGCRAARLSKESDYSSARLAKESENHIHDGRRRQQRPQDDDHVTKVGDSERKGDEQVDDDRVGKDDDTSTLPSGTTSTTPTLTPVQQKLQRNTNLASKLETRLPKGTDLMTASEGFRNLGQFVAAVNVSNNLGIDFVNLKTSMVDDGLSLGQAIQTWKPTANSTQEASRAESQATVLINASSTKKTSTAKTSTDTTSTAKTRKPTSTSGGELHD